MGRQKPTEDPLTPWEAYQAKQARSNKRPAKLKLPTVQRLRARHRNRNLALILTPLLLLLAFLGYMVSPIAKVATVSVTGTRNVPIQTVIDASRLDETKLVLGLLAHRRQVLGGIKQRVPELQAATVSVAGFNHVTFHVLEYAPVGYVLEKGRYRMILENGAEMSVSTTTPLDNYPVFSAFGTKDAAAMAIAVRKFPGAVRRTVSEVKATRGGGNPYQITMTMTDGNTVVADSRTVAKKISYYPAIVAQVKQKGTVDLEVGAFFTPYSK
ncbi:cell division protein FtsQ/DivIB [Lacticaseibacillus suihuaensis]